MNNEDSIDYWQIIEPIWYDERLNSDEPDVFLKRFSELSEPQRVLFPVHWLNAEVCNGGFHQFFSNPTGILAPEAVAGFRSIELNDFADLVKKAMLFFGNSYPRELEKRENLLNLFNEENRDFWNPFVKRDEEFDELRIIKGVSLMENDRLDMAMRNYAKRFLT